ncbi:MAG: MoaD/ThiS family protein [SAR202 cluster bacterium]|nr:MoaD/ThiS family protein [SAR202 cluster bacterium]
MNVHSPSQLRSYIGASLVEADGATLDEVLRGLDRRYPGVRFRIIDEQDRVREQIRIFVNGEQEFDITSPVGARDEIVIVGALSGG